MSNSPVEIPDAVMSAFTAAFGSVGKVKELEARIAEIEVERDTHKSAYGVVSTNLDAIRQQNDDLNAKIKELEAALENATFLKNDAADRLSFLRDAFKSVMNEANTALEIVEPAPVVIDNTVPTPNPTSDANQTSETGHGDGSLSTNVSEPNTTTTEPSAVPSLSTGQSATDPTSAPTPLEDAGTSDTVTSTEGSSAVPFTVPTSPAPSTDVPDTPATPFSTESPVTPSATASSPSASDVFGGNDNWFKPRGMAMAAPSQHGLTP